MSRGHAGRSANRQESGVAQKSELRYGVCDVASEPGEACTMGKLSSTKTAFVRVDNESISVANPLDMVRQLLSVGMSMESIELNVGLYFRSLHACVEKARKLEFHLPVRVGKGSLSIAKAMRSAAWRHMRDAMARQPGQCYLHGVRWGARRRYLDQLGQDPSFRDFVQMMRVKDLHMESLKSLKVFRVLGPDMPEFKYVYHVTDGEFPGGQYVGSYYSCISSMLNHYQRLNPDLSFGDHSVGRLPLVSIIGTNRPEDLRPFLFKHASDVGYRNVALTVSSPEFAGVPLLEGEDVYVVGSGVQLQEHSFVLDYCGNRETQSVRHRELVHSLYVSERLAGFVDVGACRVSLQKGTVFLAEPGVELVSHGASLVRYKLSDRKFQSIMTGMNVEPEHDAVVCVAQRSNLQAPSVNVVGMGEHSMVSNLRNVDVVVGKERAVLLRTLTGQVKVFDQVVLVPGGDFFRLCTQDESSVPVEALSLSVLRVGLSGPVDYGVVTGLPYLDDNNCVGRIVVGLEHVNWSLVSSVVTMRRGDESVVRAWLRRRVPFSVRIKVRNFEHAHNVTHGVCVVGQLGSVFDNGYHCYDEDELCALTAPLRDVWFVGAASFSYPKFQDRLLAEAVASALPRKLIE